MIQSRWLSQCFHLLFTSRSRTESRIYVIKPNWGEVLHNQYYVQQFFFPPRGWVGWVGGTFSFSYSFGVHFPSFPLTKVVVCCFLSFSLRHLINMRIKPTENRRSFFQLHKFLRRLPLILINLSRSFSVFPFVLPFPRPRATCSAWDETFLCSLTVSVEPRELR